MSYPAFNFRVLALLLESFGLPRPELLFTRGKTIPRRGSDVPRTSIGHDIKPRPLPVGKLHRLLLPSQDGLADLLHIAQRAPVNQLELPDTKVIPGALGEALNHLKERTEQGGRHSS